MSLNSPSSHQEYEKPAIHATLETATLTTPEGCLGEIKALITFIKAKYESHQIGNLMITVHNTDILPDSWKELGMASNEYNIPTLVMYIYDALLESEKANFRQAFSTIGNTDIGTEPTESEEELLRGIKYYLDRKLRQS